MTNPTEITCPECGKENGPLIGLNGKKVCVICFEKSIQKIWETFTRLTRESPGYIWKVSEIK